MPPRERARPTVGGDPAADQGGRVAGRRLEVLARVRAAGRPASIAELAEQLTVHPNTVRFHLDALLAAGLVRRVHGDRRVPGRPALLYAAVPGMDPAGPRRFGQLAQALAAALAGAPHGEELALEAGRAWGRDLAAQEERPAVQTGSREAAAEVDRLVALLEELDFDPVLLHSPDVDEAVAGSERAARRASPQGRDPDRIGLRRCPFLEVATSRSAVVCPVHLGLMQGAMAGWAAAVTVERLDPFAEADLCVAHLSAVAAG